MAHPGNLTAIGHGPARRSPRVTVALCGLFSPNFNVSVLAITVPMQVKDFKAPPSTVSWLVVGPTLVLLAALAAPRIEDGRQGGRRSSRDAPLGASG